MTSSTSTAVKTYRHEFSKEFMAELSRFSKVHQYDDRHTYKSEWQKWTTQTNIEQAMDFEKRRLQENGYIGDIDDKMFKAGRYYFRKKTTNNNNDNATTPTTISTAVAPVAPVAPVITAVQDLPTPPATPSTPRRTYITMSKPCIRMMDDHISSSATNASITFKPSICYTDFYETKMTTPEMTKEIENIIDKYEKTPGAMANFTAEQLTEEIMDKIKKTYKNRYYKFISSRNNNNDDKDKDNDNDD
jgi:hypothetical protein